ncbi:protein of unknown function [Burkholderia multivorans]
MMPRNRWGCSNVGSAMAGWPAIALEYGLSARRAKVALLARAYQRLRPAMKRQSEAPIGRQLTGREGCSMVVFEVVYACPSFEITHGSPFTVVPG